MYDVERSSAITEWCGNIVLCITCRGVGCIFLEMVSGTAAFQGMKDADDQLDKIFRVSLKLFCFLP